MKLTNEDYDKIAELMQENDLFIEFKKGSETLFIDYEIETDGYSEDDYFNGTGAFVTTSAEVRITDYSVENSDGENVDLILDETRLENLCKEIILSL